MTRLSVSYRKIIRKMSEQIEHAKQAKENPTLLKQHVSQIHVLCELILDEGNNDMIKDQLSSSQLERQFLAKNPTSTTGKKSIKAESTDDSIFDF